MGSAPEVPVPDRKWRSPMTPPESALRCGRSTLRLLPQNCVMSGAGPVGALLLRMALRAVPAAPPRAGMATLGQLHRQGPHRRPPKPAGPTEGRPQLKGVVLKTLIRKPKKPNSANRKCVRVRLSTGKEVVCYVPGEGHSLQEHSAVLVEGGRTQDLPGVKLKVVRGKYDCAHVQRRKRL